jgi:hypothetical protein
MGVGPGMRVKRGDLDVHFHHYLPLSAIAMGEELE